ncbi:PhzF family phenazine biosynthesis protein [Vibrio sp. NH-7]
MEFELFVCDTFTQERFKGNPAAVVPLTDWLSDDMMLKIAQENNLSETAFIKQIAIDHHEIRWFSPICEIEFCGHATLASAFTLFHFFNAGERIVFETRFVGPIEVEKDRSGRILMDFPHQMPSTTEAPVALLEGLSIPPLHVMKNPQAYFVFYDNEQDVLDLRTKSDFLTQLAPYDVVATAPSKDYDFVSRYFWPANGGDEDPVTGSIHSGLAPYWSEKLTKDHMIAYQASKRGGTLYCHVSPEKATIGGDAVLYSRGKFYI